MRGHRIHHRSQVRFNFPLKSSPSPTVGLMGPGRPLKEAIIYNGFVYVILNCRVFKLRRLGASMRLTLRHLSSGEQRVTEVMRP